MLQCLGFEAASVAPFSAEITEILINCINCTCYYGVIMTAER
jgi:hypothetical protein